MVGYNKEKIHVLANIDNYFGRHEGRLFPVVLFLLVSAAPFLVYVVLFSAVIPLRVMLVFEALWTGRMALLILGRENEKFAQYLKESGNGRKSFDANKNDDDAYVTANDLMRISRTTEDGVIEYFDGRIAYIVSGFCATYLDDVRFTTAMREFITQLRGYEYSIYTHLVVDEFRLQDNLEKLRVYKDRSMMQERMLLYQEQDRYSRENSELYRISIVIPASKYEWKTLRQKLDYLLQSETAKVFKFAVVCDSTQVNDILSRDVCANVDINKMLVKKYENDDFHNSEVLFYGDDVPEEYQVKRDKVQLSKRRVTVVK